MKKTLYFFFLLVGLFAYAQSGPNPFADKESESAFNKPTATKDNETQVKDNAASLDSGGGNPSDPVPIDNYIPLLIITAVGIMVYHTSQRKNISAKKEPNH
jgi:hypothetical protein